MLGTIGDDRVRSCFLIYVSLMIWRNLAVDIGVTLFWERNASTLLSNLGNPAGFRIANTQILVSRTALIATLLFPDFLYRMGDV